MGACAPVKARSRKTKQHDVIFETLFETLGVANRSRVKREPWGDLGREAFTESQSAAYSSPEKCLFECRRGVHGGRQHRISRMTVGPASAPGSDSVECGRSTTLSPVEERTP